MEEDRKRRLVAIMFADMAGYTALMQRNEQEGLEKVHRFSAVIEGVCQTKGGEILEFRGDGCLVVFDSAVNAMRAARDAQKQLQQDPKVPVRIGIHIGDIVFTQGKIYGDGVNLASRVESMGVPGSILFTERVLHDVKNHPEFEISSLGQFQFKNVDKPMEVYALSNEGLAVPKPEEMQGKGEHIKRPDHDTSSGQNRHWIRFGLTGFVAALGTLLFLVYSFGLKSTFSDDKQLRSERVAILPFVNKTNNPNLDILGDIAADWINRGLMEIGDAEVVSPATARIHQDAIGIRANDPEGRATFAELTGAKNVIIGNFYEDKGELVFNLELEDAEDGRLKRSFDPIKGKCRRQRRADYPIERKHLRLLVCPGFCRSKTN
ncbi:MAG: adenylate/guanylate cyclase domain-containing protein [Bacteroidia bacterium]